MIPFNKPYLSGKELSYISEAVQNGKISGDGVFTEKCHAFFQEKYKFGKVLLTTSCTDALEMAAILLDIAPGDEIIAPSYTFVSTVNAFALRGALIRFVDSYQDHPNIDATRIEDLINEKTRAIVVVHYAGVACDMDSIMAISKKHNIPVVEDAAQAIDAYYNDKPLGSFGAFSTFSFHETKNIISGEGGLLVINDEKFIQRAEIIREKGTNRASFFRGEVDKYGWVDIGSSFLPSDIIAAYLLAQLENIKEIQQRRKAIWERYFHNLKNETKISLPKINKGATNNAHMFYLVTDSLEQRSHLIAHLKQKGIHAVFHYLSLHKSPYFKDKYIGNELKNSDKFSNTLLRLPLFFELKDSEIDYICDMIIDFLQAEK